MIKLALLLSIALLFQGCILSQLDKIPKGEFEEFTYDRTGNYSSVHIIANKAKTTKNSTKIENVDITADYGPFVSFKIHLKGYKRLKEKGKTPD